VGKNVEWKRVFLEVGLTPSISRCMMELSMKLPDLFQGDSHLWTGF
jgi:hypothetical protein